MFPDRNLNPPSAGTIAQSPAKSRSPLDTPNELLPKPRSVEGKSSVLNWARTKRCIILLGISVVATFAWNVRVVLRPRTVVQTDFDPGSLERRPGWISMLELRHQNQPIGTTGAVDEAAELPPSHNCGPNAEPDLHWCVCAAGFRVGQKLKAQLQAPTAPAPTGPSHNHTRTQAGDCTDTVAYLDAGRKVEPCLRWRSKNCYDAHPGFSAADMESVRRTCPLSCGLCTPDHRTQMPDAITTAHIVCPYATDEALGGDLGVFGTTDIGRAVVAARRGLAPPQKLSHTVSASLHRKQDRHNFLAIHNNQCGCQPATTLGDRNATGPAVPLAEMPVDERSLLVVVPGMASAARVAVVERNLRLLRRGLGATIMKTCLVFTHKVRASSALSDPDVQPSSAVPCIQTVRALGACA